MTLDPAGTVRGEEDLESASTLLGHLDTGYLRLATVLPQRTGVEPRN